MPIIEIGGNLRTWEIKIARSTISETKTITITGNTLSLIYSYIPVGGNYIRQETIQRNSISETASRVVLATPDTLKIEFGTGTIT